MKKIVIGSLALASAVILSSCEMLGQPVKKGDMVAPDNVMMKKDDAMMEGQKESMEKNKSMMKKDTMKDDATMKKDGSAMMKKEISGYTTYNASAVSDALAAGKKVILFFHASWCPSCKAADANFVKETVPGDTVVFKTDYDSSTDLRKKYGVTSQHTFVSLNADATLKKKSSGAIRLTDLIDLN